MPFSLRHPESGASCDIELGRGLTYSITTRTAAGLNALLEQLLELPESQVADGAGGLVGNISVFENITLPAMFHGKASAGEIERQVLEAFADCGVDVEEAGALCRRRPAELRPFEKCLAGFVRGLLERPEILVYGRFFEGLTRTEMARSAALNAVFRLRHPAGTSVYLMLSDMPEPQLACDRWYEM